jgi:hypothetical protein
VRAYSICIALEPPGDPRGVGRGVPSVGNHCSRGLTYPYVRILSGAPEPFVASFGQIRDGDGGLNSIF